MEKNARILIVDDQRQVSRMLRSSLELTSREYDVVDVATAEEALEQLSESPFDLIVADLKLPGISGLELLHRAQTLAPHARSILITGHPTPEIRAQAEALGVVAFMIKPIHTGFFLEAVKRALELAEELNQDQLFYDYDKQRLLELLSAMQRELGAEGVLLLDDKGHVLSRSHQWGDLDVEAALPALINALRSGLKISGMLESSSPSNFQFFDGQSHHLYLTNAGSHYGLLFIFRAEDGVGQMGAVVHYARRAVGDLLACLQEMARPAEPGFSEISYVDDDLDRQEQRDEEALEIQVAASQEGDIGADQFWEEALASKDQRSPSEGDALTYEQARKLGLVGNDLDPDEEPA